jgi:sugar phosphate isomerase/epimerase
MDQAMTYSRRDIGKMALAALSARQLLARPNSKFGGVQIGVIVSPVGLADLPLQADQLLQYLVRLGIDAVELQDVRVESYAGAPTAVRKPGTPVSEQARRQAAQQLSDWRLSASMDKYQALERMYRDAGVNIYAFRLAILDKQKSDAEFDYFFRTARALGADHITTELPTDSDFTARICALAAKHRMMAGYHNHTQVKFNSWDTALSQSKYNGINFDVGHYAAAVSESPVPFLEKYHDRITCLHLKDRKFGTHGGQNVPWGEGDTPLREVLQAMRRGGYRFPAGIELEYKVPPASTSMAELERCLKFCKDALA